MEVEVDEKQNACNSTIAMQNLRRIGFADAVNKKKGLNIHYAKLALAELAKFHSLGYVYINSFKGGIEGNQHKILQQLVFLKACNLGGRKEEDFMTTDFFVGSPTPKLKEIFDKFKDPQIEGFYDLLSTVQEPGQDFVGSLKAKHKEEDIMDARDELCRPRDDEFNTFCHGDAWFNNMMF